MDFIGELLVGESGEVSLFIKYLSLLLLAAIIILICLVAFYISRKIVRFVLPKYIKKSKGGFDDILLENKFYERLAHLVPIIILNIAKPLFNDYSEVIDKFVSTYLIIILVLLAISALDSVDTLYKQYEISKTRPITGILQIVKVVIYIVTAILLIANLMGESPLALLGGIGALSAVFSLVFKDPILGFVGGIQLTSTDMLRVGDWIHVPKYNAEGSVTEISLTTISIQAFDKTTITVPNYSLITDSFVNYRGMQDSGGRRIKRKIYVDMNSIRLCSKEELDQYKEIDGLNEYISNKESEVMAANPDIIEEEKISKMNITNVQILRAYAQNYIKNNPKLRKDMTLMVRPQEAEGNGLPIEVYAFTDTTVWVDYEGVQAEVFDHIYYAMSEFDLKPYQRPSGHDLKQVSSSKI